jgi:hypothetical protein
MFILDFKSWLEAAGEVDPPAKLTNDYLDGKARSRYVSSKIKKDGLNIKNPFTTNIRRKNYGKSIASNHIST